MVEKQRLDQILEDLKGSTVRLSFVCSGGERIVEGVLVEVDKDIIWIKDLLGETLWINRHGSTLVYVRLLKRG